MNFHREFADRAASIGRSCFDGTRLMRFFAGFLVSMVASFASAAFAQTSDADATYLELMNKGRSELAESYNPDTPELSVSHAAAALKLFQAAEKLRPDLLDPIFFEGVALNATKDYCLAVRKIERVKAAGYPNPLLSLQLGIALVNCGSTTEGIANLQEFLKTAPPGPDQASAQKLLKDALDQQKTSKENAARRAAAPNVTASPSGKPPPPKKMPFTLSIVSGLGYNDNVISIGKNAVLPAGISQKAAFYNESGLALGRDWPLSHQSGELLLADKFSLAYAMAADTYDDIPSKNRILQTAIASYSRSLNPFYAAFLKVSDLWIRLDGSNFSNNIAVQPALVYTPDERLTTQISYVFNRSDFFIPSTPSSDPNGFTHRAELSQSYVMVQDGEHGPPVLTVTGVYGREWTLTDGIEGDMTRDDLLAKLTWTFLPARDQCAFLRNVTLTWAYNHRFDHYSHATFPTATDPNRFRRSDDTDIAAVALNIKMWYDQAVADEGIKAGNRLEAILQYQFTSRDSNVTAKEFDQNYIIASLKYNF